MCPTFTMYICLKICPTPRCKSASICLILKTWLAHFQICLINFTNGKVTKFKMKISQLPDLPDLAQLPNLPDLPGLIHLHHLPLLLHLPQLPHLPQLF